MKRIKLLFSKIKLTELIENKWFSYAIIFLFSFLILLPFLFGKFHLGDDGMYHMATIEAYSYDLPFSVFAKILPQVGDNLGFGTGIFYPALPHITGAILFKFISLFGFGLIAMEHLLHLLIVLLSGITMFWFAQKVFKDNKKSLFCSLFYITYNYLFVDIVMRDALNESFMFIFMPLVFLGLYYLFYEKNAQKFYLWFILGYLGLMYSHLVMTVYFTIFLIIVLLFYFKEVFNKNNFKHLFIASILILLLSSTFTVLMIEHKIYGDYYVFDKFVWTKDNVWGMPFIGYFYPYYYATGFDGLIYANINCLVIIFLILTIYKLITKKISKPRRKFIFAIGLFWILGILLNSFTGLWLHIPNILLSIQFLWRLSAFVGFGVAIFADESLDLFFNCFKKSFIFVGMLVLMLPLGYFIYYNHTKVVYHESFWYEDRFSYGAVREYFPNSTFKNHRDYFYNRSDTEINILSGRADVKLLNNVVPKMRFSVSNLKENAIIELPRLYYLGYEIVGPDGKKISYKEDKYGFVSLEITKNGIYRVNYIGTKAYQIAVVIKSLTILVILGYYIYYRKKRPKGVEM